MKKFEITAEQASMMEVLCSNYPKYTKICDLQVENTGLDETILGVRELIEYGVIMTKENLNALNT